MFPKLHPEVEQLELRFLPSILNFSSATYSVNEDAGKFTVTVNLDVADPNNTITVHYATSDGSATAGIDYTGTSGTLTFSPNTTSQTFNVPVTDDNVNDSNKTVNLALSSPVNATLGSTNTATLTIDLVYPTTSWTAGTQQRVNDPYQSLILPFGVYTFSPTTGALIDQQALDFRRSLPNANDAWDSEGIPTPSLIYWSDSVSVKPIIEGTLVQKSGDSYPTQIVATLTWNGGTAQTPVTFTGFSGGSTNTYLVAVQVSSAVTASGVYSWSLTLDASFSDRGDVVRTVTGKADVVVNDASLGLPYGWGISGITDRLVADGSSGMLWIMASGGSRYFSGTGPTYTSPANDFGSLVRNVDNSYTYSAINQVKWNFSSSGYLTSVVDPHGLTESLAYVGGQLSTVTMPDGGIATLTYSGGMLNTITEPGNRVVTLTIDGSNNLTGLALPDGALRTLTYDSHHRLTNELWGQLNTTFAYDATYGTLSSIDRGGSSTLGLGPEAIAAVNPSSGKLTTDAVAWTTDALNLRTTMTLDTLGRITQMGTASASGLGGSVPESWTRNSAGQVTVYTDTMGYPTTYVYRR